MITMHVGDEDGVQLGEVDMGTTELHLCTLATIYHIALSPHLYELRGSIVFQGWQRTATPQYMYLKWFQLNLKFRMTIYSWRLKT